VPKPQLFIQFDYTKLVNTFTDIGDEHIAKIFSLIVEETRDELESLYGMFKSVAEQLKTPSTDLKHLKGNKDLYEKTMAEREETYARIKPIENKLEYLKKMQQDDQLTEEEHNKIKMMEEAWKKFEDDLDAGQQVLSKSQKQLRQEVESQLDDFRRAVEDNKKTFQQNAPYNADSNTENVRSKEKLGEHKTSTNDLREREEAMKFGEDIFGMEHQSYPELSFVEKQSELLEDIWNVKEEWDAEWEIWKAQKFADLEIQEMDDKAGYFQDKLKSFDRETRSWGIYDYLKNKIESFRQTMPLIMDLRSEAMRPRHWKDLRHRVKEDFDEKSDEFTLEKVFDLGLNQHAAFISELAENAAKELKIERQLEKIRYTWEEDHNKTDLILSKEISKGTGEEYYKIATAENIYSVIEEHVVILSNHKSGAFYKKFEEQIDKWEENLSQISEIIELLMIVQSKWGYLESIFSGQQDIMKQLATEHTIFQGVNSGFRAELERINKDKNALRSLTVKGLDKTLEEMDERLEYIQKNLDDYLKLKRQSFPRFFFLSNEDLLEIMGQSKDPTPMNKHVKKCFEGIQHLQITKQSNRAKPHQIVGLTAPDGEEVPLSTPIAGLNKVEDWFKDLLKGMQSEIQALFKDATSPLKDALKRSASTEKLAECIRNRKGQFLITSCQIEWTKEVAATLMALESGSVTQGYKKLKNSYRTKIDKYTGYVKKLSEEPRTRNKLMALITIELHNKEIIEQLAKDSISSSKHFSWTQQLRLYREESETASDPPSIVVRQTTCSFAYGNEYQGNNGRLVITPLTDRAYMTMTNALNMCRGGAPQGPAGTGKTETVKDLGKNLAYFVVVQNCSDSLTYQALGRMFEGLASAGVWGCFDEFNRIEIEVLSVVAQQISTILDAIKRRSQTCIFEGSEIPVEHSCGIFITMNPGYAGRSELPDNLKSLFRPVAMMVPDFNIIAKIILMSEGFDKSEELSVKVVKMYELMKKQLSKQSHYDFGMRAVKSVLSTAGRIKRSKHDQDEYTIMIKAIRDMNLPKFLSEDVILFDHLFIDLFPGIEEPFYENDDLLLAIEDSMTNNKLQINANLAVKIVQLYESNITRHGNMIVGKTLAGKTTVINVLFEA
jgi:dynein heavy chain